MFASLAQGTPGAAPVHNPFATVPPKGPKGETNPFGGFGAGAQTHKKHETKNPFQANDASSSDGGGGKQKGKRVRSDGLAKNLQGKDGTGRPQQHNGDRKNVSFAVQKPDDQGSRAASPSSQSPDTANKVTVVPYNSADPLARKIYQRLREDGISPPTWPSQPGNPDHKQAMAKFREQYEMYRKKVRASLTRAGLIDDPEKRKALSDAIEFKGICEDMCPEFEKITRITEFDVVHAEKDPRTTYANTSKMVKKLARSAAGQEAPLPMDVRSVSSLRRTLDYLLDDLLRDDGNLPVVHGFLWDRTRAIRRDFSFFSSLTPEEIKTQVYVLENIARFHVTSLHLLSQEDRAPEDFVQQQELEQLGKALLSLRDVYDDCGEQGITCENESEFRAYYLLFHARDPSILETLQRQWKSRHWRDSDDVRTAVSLVEALQDTHDFHGPLKAGPSLAASAALQAYFRIVQDPKVSYTMACFAECHFPQLRRSMLQIMKRALSRPKDTAKDVTAAALNEFLQFDTVQQAIDFAELHNLELEPNPEDPSDVERRILILDGRRPLPHRRLAHQYSEKMVERKRSSRPLPEVIHRTVFEDARAARQVNGSGPEESLFVQDDGVKAQPKPALNGFPFAGSGPFQSSTPLPSSFGASTVPKRNGGNHQQSSNSRSPFGTGNAQQATATTNKNPFAPTATSSKDIAANPFESTGSWSASLSAPKKDGEGTARPGTFGSGTQTANHSSAVAPESAAAKTSLFGNQKSASPGTSLGSPSMFASKNSNQGTKGTSPATTQHGEQKATTPSFFMPPPPKPEPKPPSIASDISCLQTATPPSAFFPAQNQPVRSLGQASMPWPTRSGSTMTDGTKPGGSNAVTTAATSSSAKAPVFFGAQTSTDVAASAASPTPEVSALSTMTSKPTPTPMQTRPTIQPGLANKTATTNVNQASNPSPAEPSAQATTAPSVSACANARVSSGEAASPAPAPPRDLMGDFTRWFVKGDNGILDQFQVFLVDEMLSKTFAAFQEEGAETRRREEENRTNQEVDRFRRYNLSVKYFYRWKQNARERRLRSLRRNGREQLRAFYMAQHAAGRRAQKEAAIKAAKQRAEAASFNRPDELMDMLRRRKMNRGEAREALLSSGVLSGVANERDAVESLVRQEFRSRSNSAASSAQSGDPAAGSHQKVGAKTRALRELYLGGSKPGRFRRSLPSLNSSSQSDSAAASSSSNASARWRLKAMGIEPLPDGTAVPASMAHDMRSHPKEYSRLLAFGSAQGGGSTRRASVSGGSRMLGSPRWKMGIPTVDDGRANNHKRKRSEEEDGGQDGDGETKTGTMAPSDRTKHKRIMSDAERLTSELRAIRQELEEGREWFRSQNERLRSESRGVETQGEGGSAGGSGLTSDDI